LALVTNQFFRLHPLGQEAAVLQPYTNTAAKEVKCIFTSPAIKQYCPDSDKLETYIFQSAEARGGLNKAIPTAWTMSPGLTPCVYNMPLGKGWGLALSNDVHRRRDNEFFE